MLRAGNLRRLIGNPKRRSGETQAQFKEYHYWHRMKVQPIQLTEQANEFSGFLTGEKFLDN
jgi:hypothetical protein